MSTLHANARAADGYPQQHESVGVPRYLPPRRGRVHGAAMRAVAHGDPGEGPGSAASLRARVARAFLDAGHGSTAGEALRNARRIFRRVEIG